VEVLLTTGVWVAALKKRSKPTHWRLADAPLTVVDDLTDGPGWADLP
jgi:hypothetical protein